MHLERCKDQKRQTLDEFYSDLAKQEELISQTIGRTMLSLIARIRKLPDPRRLYGLTSHYHLILLAEDTSQSSWLVKSIALDGRNYTIEYLMPKRHAPWPNAYVKGEAQSEDQAVQMIVTAIERSEGWKNIS
jgi:hypothetical protein